jgi:cbb3-type cytochrome oxidase maturation protein
MNGLMVLIPVALVLGGTGLAAFLWSLRAGQYDDLDGAAVRILRDDQSPSPASTSTRDAGVRTAGRHRR